MSACAYRPVDQHTALVPVDLARDSLRECSKPEEEELLEGWITEFCSATLEIRGFRFHLSTDNFLPYLLLF